MTGHESHQLFNWRRWKLDTNSQELRDSVWKMRQNPLCKGMSIARLSIYSAWIGKGNSGSRTKCSPIIHSHDRMWWSSWTVPRCPRAVQSWRPASWRKLFVSWWLCWSWILFCIHSNLRPSTSVDRDHHSPAPPQSPISIPSVYFAWKSRVSTGNTNVFIYAFSVNAYIDMDSLMSVWGNMATWKSGINSQASLTTSPFPLSFTTNTSVFMEVSLQSSQP